MNSDVSLLMRLGMCVCDTVSFAYGCVCVSLANVCFTLCVCVWLSVHVCHTERKRRQ